MTSSASKYIGIDSKGNRVERTDLMFLDALARCEGPVTTDALIEIADPRNMAKLSVNDTIRQLTFLLADGYVNRSEAAKNGSAIIGWLITNKGRAHLIAQEARNIFDECARYTPVARDRRSADKPRIEEAPEPVRTAAGAVLHEQLKGSHILVDEQAPVSVSVCDARDPDDVEPPSALLCVDEDELDEWWQNLDVEAKADAFVQWSLGNHGRNSHIHIEEPADRVPFRGIVGDLSKNLTDRLRGAGIAAVQS